MARPASSVDRMAMREASDRPERADGEHAEHGGDRGDEEAGGGGAGHHGGGRRDDGVGQTDGDEVTDDERAGEAATLEGAIGQHRRFRSHGRGALRSLDRPVHVARFRSRSSWFLVRGTRCTCR